MMETKHPSLEFHCPATKEHISLAFGYLANKPQYLRMIEDPERCAQLQAKSRAAEIEMRMQKQAKNDMSVSEFDRILEPLREEYAKRNRVGKAALLATIYERISLV